jgi:hypothetical protein
MTFEEIITSFADSDTIPVEGMRAALAAPTDFLDKAVPLLERIAATTSSDEEDASLTVLVHVLGEIGDGRAFLPLMRVLALPSEELELLLGDAITEALGSVLISLAGDRAAVLEEALADTGIDDFVRAAVFEAWTRLALIGTVPKERAQAFLSDYPVRVGLDTSDFGWSSWVDSVTALGLAEMTDFARRHLPTKAVMTSVFDVPNVTYDDFERQLAETLADPESWKDERKYQPFSGTIEELSNWYGYSEKYRQERARGEAEEDEAKQGWAFEDGQGFGAPYIAANSYRDVGRNDPCPCGSGKKFKKCCLN